MTVKPIPEDLHTLTPFLAVRGAAALIEFLVIAFDAGERERIVCPDGTVAHAQVKIGDSVVMIAEPRGGAPVTPAALQLYLLDADAAYARALAAGATSLMEPTDMFWGDRMGVVQDAWGNRWQLATRIEDLSPEEVQRRMATIGR